MNSFLDALVSIEQAKYKCFQEKVSSIFEAENDKTKKQLFGSLVFDDEGRTFTIESSKFEIEKDSQIVIQLISEIVQLLKGMSFLGVSLFQINITRFLGELDYQTMKDLILSLSTLKNIQSLKVVQQNNDDWNLYSLLLFSSFEITDEFEHFSYESQHADLLLNINQIRLTYTIHHYFHIIQSLSMTTNIQKLKTTFGKLFNLSRVFSEENNKWLRPLQNSQKIMKYVSYQQKEADLFPNVIAFSNLMRIWNLDSLRISNVEFQFLIQNLNGYVDDGDYENLYNELKDIQIFDKTLFSIFLDKRTNPNPIITLLKLVRGVKLDFLGSGPSFDDQNNEIFFKRLSEESSQPGVFDNIKVFEMKVKLIEQIQQFKQIVRCFSKVEEVTLQRDYFKEFNNDFSAYFQGIMRLVSRVRKLNFMNVIQFNLEMSYLFVTQSPRRQGFVFISEELPKAIENMNKPIHLELTYIYEPNADNQNAGLKEIIEGIKKIIGVSQVVELELNCDLQIPEIHSIISERNSFYKSVVAYSLLVGSYMMYNPQAILADLFDFIN